MELNFLLLKMNQTRFECGLPLHDELHKVELTYGPGLKVVTYVNCISEVPKEAQRIKILDSYLLGGDL